MSGENGFSPKIVAYVCNWCTYLGADLAARRGWSTRPTCASSGCPARGASIRTWW